MLGISSIPWLYRYLAHLIPVVESNMTELNIKAAEIEDRTLKVQALNSLRDKAFHCYGGAVLALLAPRSRQMDMIVLITALQTISDYLDNLCDRVRVQDEKAFATLHESMLAAVTPGAKILDYYSDYSDCSERVYLPWLVARCQSIAATLRSLDAVYPYVAELIALYSNLQVFKHLDVDKREERLKTYLGTYLENIWGLEWWELAAASGSTLGMFALLSYAAEEDLSALLAKDINDAYFPWIGGFHILLDYLIDQEEDSQEGDLNFVGFYRDDESIWRAVRSFAARSFGKAALIKPSAPHILTVSGLMAMYLSDPKIRLLGAGEQASATMKEFGWGITILYKICRYVRRKKGF